MSTLGVMKARIASELRRSNISTQIAAAIATAIGEYQKDRFTFTESRSVTFSTVAGQEFYTTADSASIPLIRKLDYVKCYVGSTAYDVCRQSMDIMEELSDAATNTGQPSEYGLIDDALRLYPVPDAVYTIRLGGVFALAAPAADDTAGNKWMTRGERLIRSRAKLELAIHVLMDQGLADAMGAATEDAFASLKIEAFRASGAGTVRPWC